MVHVVCTWSLLAKFKNLERVKRIYKKTNLRKNILVGIRKVMKFLMMSSLILMLKWLQLLASYLWNWPNYCSPHPTKKKKIINYYYPITDFVHNLLFYERYKTSGEGSRSKKFVRCCPSKKNTVLNKLYKNHTDNFTQILATDILFKSVKYMTQN